MKQSNLLFIGGAFTILLIAGFCGMLVWAFLTKNDDKPWPPTKETKDSIAVEIKEVIKEVPVKVYVHDTVRIKIPCTKQHCETKTDTAE
jgi:hypothetical protein